MKPAKMVAYASVSAALATVFLAIGEFFPTFSLSAAFMASLAMMIPLTKKSYAGAVLAYISSALLALLITGFRFEGILPFAAFCGLHPLVNAFIEDKKINKILGLVVKDVWFVGVAYLTYFLTDFASGGTISNSEFLKNNIIWLIGVGSAIAFVAYDFCMAYFQKKLNIIVEKLKL